MAFLITKENMMRQLGYYCLFVFWELLFNWNTKKLFLMEILKCRSLFFTACSTVRFWVNIALQSNFLMQIIVIGNAHVLAWKSDNTIFLFSLLSNSRKSKVCVRKTDLFQNTSSIVSKQICHSWLWLSYIKMHCVKLNIK